MRVSVRSAAEYELPAETFVVLMVEPALRGPNHRVIQESLRTTPTRTSEIWNDPAGNVQRRMLVPAGRFSFEFSAIVENQPSKGPSPGDAELPPPEIPPEAMVYTLPSRYCQSDLLTRMARSEFGQVPPGAGRVAAISAWVREHVEYRYGTTDSKTSAFDTATERVGVCRDFAHLVVTFCRALQIPARYASGYALGLEPPDFHGIAQVYLSGAWHDVDATTPAQRPAIIPIAVGRDAADVAIATIFGSGDVLSQSVEVREITG